MDAKRNPAEQGGESANSCGPLDHQHSRINAVVKAEQRRITNLISDLRDAGYVVGVACDRCGTPVWAPRSFLLGMGPVCRKGGRDD